MCGVVPVLDGHGLLGRVFSSGGDVDELAAEYRANAGYLNVALRMLGSQGVLEIVRSEDRVHYRPSIGAEPTDWFRYSMAYVLGLNWIKQAEGMWNKPEEALSSDSVVAIDVLLDALEEIPEEGILARIKWHLEGALVAPWLVTVGTLNGTAPIESWAEHDSIVTSMHHTKQEMWGKILTSLGWDHNEIGAFYLKRASAYGVTTSYMKSFVWSKELIFGDSKYLWRVEPGENEIHVDRTLNVWGSGGAHKAYFSHLDAVVKGIFNAPLESQPKGICDMGCGNGALLLHLYEVIKSSTLRGKHLDEHPLELVGADFNKEALIATSKNFKDVGVDGNFLWGDIGDPDRLALDLWDLHKVKLGELLNVRSFLDHNRIFNRPTHNRAQTPTSTGAFSFRGERLKLRDVEQSLLEHFTKWSPYVSDHGLLVIELHTIDPEAASDLQGKLPVTAYDATHGFTDQYIVEIPVYDSMALEAGLKVEPSCSRTFPSERPSSVSIRYFKSTIVDNAC